MADSEKSSLDSVLLVVALAILLAGVYGFYYFQDYAVFFRVVGLLLVAGIALTVSLQTATGRNVLGFAQAARTELRKVVWPTRKETLQATAIIVVAVFIIGILLWILDAMLLEGVRFITGQGD